MKDVRSLVYKPTVNNTDYVAQVACDSAVDTQWRVYTQGSVDGNPTNVVPNYVTIDNILNKTSATIQFGPYTWTVPAYTRKSFLLPQPTISVLLILSSGIINLLLVENPNFSPDDANLLLIQEAARGVSLFPFVLYNAALTQQQLTDANSVVEFVSNAPMTYALLQAGPNIANGWFQFVFNNGTAPVTLLPFGADTIDTIYNNASGFVLYPGEWGTLNSDASQWFCKVYGQKRPSLTTANASTTQSVNDLNKRLLFNSGSGQAYNLLAANTFTNGDRLTVKNGGAVALAIVPSGAETINGLYTAGNPLFLSPGDVVDLYVNESQDWAADGEITFQSAPVTFGVGTFGHVAHHMRQQPFGLECWVLCLVAQIGFLVGDQFLLPNSQSVSSDPGASHSVIMNATDIHYTWSSRSVTRFSQVDNGGDSDIDTTRFNIFFRCRVRL